MSVKVGRQNYLRSCRTEGTEAASHLKIASDMLGGNVSVSDPVPSPRKTRLGSVTGAFLKSFSTKTTGNTMRAVSCAPHLRQSSTFLVDA